MCVCVIFGFKSLCMQSSEWVQGRVAVPAVITCTSPLFCKFLIFVVFRLFKRTEFVGAFFKGTSFCFGQSSEMFFGIVLLSFYLFPFFSFRSLKSFLLLVLEYFFLSFRVNPSLNIFFHFIIFSPLSF